MEEFRPPRHIVWSTDRLDLGDPFQRRWYLAQVLMHGRAQDLKALDLDEVAAVLDDVSLPPEVYSLWKRLLEHRHADR